MYDNMITIEVFYTALQSVPIVISFYN